ncbi:unnamed protein product [Haemonchus placei]|uniref:Tetratricopeptide repeat protein n=1 Tax=Haemonchus placei TaxID=6290 RepID=A0A0N4WJ10_HAEPC|nr:unnamed protein product [Haemonchus placei]
MHFVAVSCQQFLFNLADELGDAGKAMEVYAHRL